MTAAALESETQAAPALPERRDFVLPGFIAAINRRLPQWPHALPLCLALEAAVRCNVIPPLAKELCEGKIVRVAVEDGGTQALFTCQNGHFRPIFRGDTPFDVSFAGNAAAFLKLLLREDDPDTLFFNRDLFIEGDTELGLAIKNMLDAIDWPPPFIAALLAKFRN
ncbi:MAG: SCP2 sterol-binding domain-containing protein [Zoogloeaceae bacterium]|nr:SCP2 sterol-binding domain-containing protein [Zoogloeaceae bacterium]